MVAIFFSVNVVVSFILRSQAPRWQARTVSRWQARTVSACEAPAEWKSAEDWALVDGAGSFTVGRGAEARTFWQALQASSPALAARSVTELETRLRSLSAEQSVNFGPQPEVLEAWEMLSDGRCAGRLEGRAVWLSVALAGKLESDPRSSPGYIEAVGGKVYELGTPAASSAGSGKLAEPATPAATWGLSNPIAGGFGLPAAGAVAVLGGAIGFLAANLLAPPPPPPPPPPMRVFISRPARPAVAGGGTESSRPAAPPTAALTTAEARERAELRVQRDQKRIEMMQLKLREDEQALSEARRVESERGSGADAVRLIFPPAGNFGL